MLTYEPVVRLEGLAQLGPERAECAHAVRGFGTEHALHADLRDPRREVAEQAVLLAFRRAVDDVGALGERGEQRRDLLRRVLEVVVHGDDDRGGGGADAAQHRVVLPVVPQEPDAVDPGVRGGQALDGRPAGVPAPVVDQQQFDRRANRRAAGRDPRDQQLQAVGGVVDRHDDRDAARGSRHDPRSRRHARARRS